MGLIGGEGPVIIAIMVVELFIAYFFVAARLYTRLVLKPIPLGWDDWTMIATVVLFTVYSWMCVAAAALGMGRHSATLQIDQIAEANKIEIIGQTFCILGIATSKASVSLFLMRIVVSRWQQAVLWAVMIWMTITCLLTVIVDFVQCDPVAHVWNPTIPAHCWTSITPWALATGGLSVIADVVLAVLPWIIIWDLQMPQKDKWLIGTSLSFGIFAAICGIVRTVALNGLNARSDYTYATVGLILWSATETVITIITACIPTLRPFWYRIRGRLSSNYRSSDDTDEFPDPSKNRPPFLSHHMRNLQRQKYPTAEKQTENTLNGTLFGTVITNVDGGKTLREDGDSGKSILVNGGEMGHDIRKTCEVSMDYEQNIGGSGKRMRDER